MDVGDDKEPPQLVSSPQAVWGVEEGISCTPLGIALEPLGKEPLDLHLDLVLLLGGLCQCQAANRLSTPPVVRDQGGMHSLWDCCCGDKPAGADVAALGQWKCAWQIVS